MVESLNEACIRYSVVDLLRIKMQNFLQYNTEKNCNYDQCYYRWILFSVRKVRRKLMIVYT